MFDYRNDMQNYQIFLNKNTTRYNVAARQQKMFVEQNYEIITENHCCNLIKQTMNKKKTTP